MGILFNEAERTCIWVKDVKWSQVLFGALVWPRGLPNIKAFSSADQRDLHESRKFDQGAVYFNHVLIGSTAVLQEGGKAVNIKNYSFQSSR